MTAAAVVVWGAAMAAMPAVLQVRVLDTAPFDVAVASSVYVVAFYVAIGGGALLGAALLDAAGPRGPAVGAAVLALVSVPLALLARSAAGRAGRATSSSCGSRRRARAGSPRSR